MTPSMRSGGWSLWAYAASDDSPYCYRTVEIWRHEWAEPRCVTPWNLPPQMNVVDLYWRPLRQDDS